LVNGSNLPFRDLRRWINQERGIHSSSNGDSDNANEKTNLHHQQQQQLYQQQQRRRTTTYHGNTRSINIQQNLFGVDQQTSSFSK